MKHHQDDQNKPNREDDWFERELREHKLPSAREGFKENLAEAFATGEFQERETCEEFRSDLRERFVRGRMKKRPAAPRLLRYVLPIAAAAVLIFTQLPSSIGGSVEWEMLEIAQDASILGSVADWQEVHTGNDRLRLKYGEAVFVEIGANSRVERLSLEGGEKLNASEGSLIFTAPEGEEPITFLIETPDAVIQITSNSVGVDVYESGTCVCVLDGEVVVTPRVGERKSHAIQPGRSCFVHKDGAVQFSEVLPEPHETPIRELKEFVGL